MNPTNVQKIQKRDGRVVDFDKNKIINAIFKAMTSTNQGTFRDAKAAGSKAVKKIESKSLISIPTVEEIQDIVETVLIEEGFDKAAKEYIIYRKKRSELRDAKRLVGVSDDLKLTINANLVLEKRYLLKNEINEIIETPKQMFMRVAKSVAAGDLKHDPKNVANTEKEFFNVMSQLYFLPNSPTIMNAGTRMPQLSACFVLPVGDSMKEIFNSVRNMALIHQSGGGTGFSFSNLRPRGDIVNSTHGTASGPVSFMRVFDTAADIIKQGGRRRGANMGILNVNHPDIIEFIRSKSREGNLSNFNLSVAITDDFMKKVDNQDLLDLINPRTGKIVRNIPSQDILNLMVTMAWSTGDPGVIFIDEINRHNPTPNFGRIESTNPCGEQPLLQYESCNLGSINLSKIVQSNEIDWGLLKDVISTSIHFLDNVIDVNRYPLKRIAEMSYSNRKIGLGVMGFAEMLIQLGIPYDSNEALHLAERLMAFISNEAQKKSKEIADRRGSFPNFDNSTHKKKGLKRIRNATTTTVAPTGTISIIAGCSSGIEPLFAVSFIRNVLEGSKLLEVNPLFEKIVRDRGIYSQDLMMEIAKKGSLQRIDGLPKDLKNMFITAMDIPPEWHVKMQAAFQKNVDNAVSKTVNLPHDAPIEDVSEIYRLAHKLKCKGITVYRYGSKTNQVFSLGGKSGLQRGGLNEYIGAEANYSGGCPHPLCDIY
jgi:ribonucleoside-diphosphate reductase alpha chain